MDMPIMREKLFKKKFVHNNNIYNNYICFRI